MSAEGPDIVWFEHLGRGDVARVGGKNASLVEMVRNLHAQRVGVPPGFATTARAYWRFIDANNLRPMVASHLDNFESGKATLAEVEAAVDAEIGRIVKDGVGAEELERAKNRFVRSMIFARDRQSSMANIYGAALATGSSVKDVEDWPDRIRAVMADQIKAAAARYLTRNNSVTGYLMPPATVEN